MQAPVNHSDESEQPVVVSGKVFPPELIEHLNDLHREDPDRSNNAVAKVICEHLAWFSPDGRPALAGAKVALGKLRHKGLLLGPQRRRRAGPHQLRGSGEFLPPVSRVPRRVDQIQGLQLYLLSGHTDPLSTLWNDFMIQQHPCAGAPLVGAQLRYLIGSEHGWLGALGFGPAAFQLPARDHWIGWSKAARVGHLREVVGLSRFLIRREVKTTHLASKVLGMALKRLPRDWHDRYRVKPRLVETFVDRERFTGLCFRAANWQRVGVSSGRGRLGPPTPSKTPKDIWVYPLDSRARPALQQEMPAPLVPCSLLSSLERESWCARELGTLNLQEVRLERRTVRILEARWAQPQASFHGSFSGWTDAKGAYQLIEHPSPLLTLDSVLQAHGEATQQRMAAERLVLCPEDTTTLSYTGLKRTIGLGPLGEDKGRGLWLHSLLAFRPDAVPLGVLHAQCWARPKPGQLAPDAPGRNAKSVDQKESGRWVKGLRVAGSAARRMPHVVLVVITDREGDLYELHDAVHIGPPNLHLLVRAQHNRKLESHQKLWSFMTAQPVGLTRILDLPRGHGQSARHATVQVRWAAVDIQSPAVGHKKNGAPLRLWAVWVYEPDPPSGVNPLNWMLLTDLPVENAEQAWEKVHWYRVRWGIEEWHRVLKTGCNAEGREFKTAEHLRRVLAFDLIVAWRVLACLKLGRKLPQLSASLIYTEEELKLLWAAVKKTPAPAELESG